MRLEFKQTRPETRKVELIFVLAVERHARIPEGVTVSSPRPGCARRPRISQQSIIEMEDEALVKDRSRFEVFATLIPGNVAAFLHQLAATGNNTILDTNLGSNDRKHGVPGG